MSSPSKDKALTALAANVLFELVRAVNAKMARDYFEHRMGTYSSYVVDDDDRGMLEASGADLFAWVDDLEHRVGLDAAEMRAAVLDYVLVRYGAGDPDTDAERARLIAEYGHSRA